MKVVLSGSDILYHGTRLQNAINILKHKKFLLQATTVRPEELRFGPQLFFLSTTRSILSEFLQKRPYVVFQLDGKKIAHNHKVVPVSYFWVPETKRLAMPDNEMEERVLSDDPVLGIEHVTAIHVPVQNADKNSLQLLKRLALKLGIPAYFYDSTIVMTTHPSKRITLPIFPAQDEWYAPDVVSIKMAKTVSTLAVAPPDKRLYSTDTVQQLLHYMQDPSFVKHLFDTNQFSEYLVPAIRKMRKAGYDSQDLMYYILVKSRLANDNSSILDLHYLLSKTKYSREDKQFTNTSPYILELEHRIITEYRMPIPEANEILEQYGTFDTAMVALKKRMKVR